MFDFKAMIEEKAKLIINDPNSDELEKIYEGYHDYNFKWARDILLTIKTIKDNNYIYSDELLTDPDKELSNTITEDNRWVNIAVKGNKYNINSELVVIPEEEGEKILEEKLYNLVNRELVKYYSSFTIGENNYFVWNNTYNKCKKCEYIPTEISYEEFNEAYKLSLN
jgi:hypothetical protein